MEKYFISACTQIIFAIDQLCELSQKSSTSLATNLSDRLSIESEAIYFTPFYLPKSAIGGKMIRTSPTQIPILKTADLIGLISKKSKNTSKFKINIEIKLCYLRLQLTSYTIAI